LTDGVPCRTLRVFNGRVRVIWRANHHRNTGPVFAPHVTVRG
jgi:hypothetical protein